MFWFLLGIITSSLKQSVSRYSIRLIAIYLLGIYIYSYSMLASYVIHIFAKHMPIVKIHSSTTHQWATRQYRYTKMHHLFLIYFY